MKTLPVIAAALAFMLPIGFVCLTASSTPSKPVNGKLLYFYAPS